MGLAEAPELGEDALGGEERGGPGRREELAEGVVGGEEAVDEEVVDEGAVDEHLVGLAEAEAGRVELDRLPVPRPLLHPHRGRTGGSRRAAAAAVALACLVERRRRGVLDSSRLCALGLYGPHKIYGHVLFGWPGSVMRNYGLRCAYSWPI